jgi:GNAT superfamily N-acetyltransferase
MELDTSAWSLVEEPVPSLAEHGRIPISFCVDRRFEITPIDGGLGGIVFREQSVDRPFFKDYDAPDGAQPARWAELWDLGNWGLVSGYYRGERVGGVVLAFDTQGVEMLEGRKNLAVIWDIRVSPGFRRQGLGKALFLASETWARVRGCRWLKVETQNINVPACRFYAKQGCILGSINTFAYPDFPDETQLLWYKDLTE